MSQRPSLTEVTKEAHGHLKVVPNCAEKVAKHQHMINIKVNEIGQAGGQFPIFLSRMSDNADWAISAINSFEVEKNLFVDDDKWTANYTPTGLQTYPFFVMRKPGSEGKQDFCIGINEESDAFSETEGEPLFEENSNQASVHLSRVTHQLQQELQNDVHSFQFCKLLEELGLIKAVDLKVQYVDGRLNTLKGLNTIDEVALQELSDEKLLGLRQRGYLLPTYALLTSVFQVNALLRKHNEVFGQNNAIAQVSFEMPKDDAA